MIEFGQVDSLLYLWLLLPCAWLIWRGYKVRLKRLSYFIRRVRDLSSVRRKRRMWLKMVLFLTALACLCIALSQPRSLKGEEEVETKGIDIMIVVDVSQSMLVSDQKPNRLETAKREIEDLLTMLDGDRVGLVAFAGLAFVHCPLTEDYIAFKTFLDQLSPELVPVGGSVVADALTVGLQSLKQAAPDTSNGQAILMISDGENLDSSPFEVARRAKKQGVQIYTLGVGEVMGGPIPMKSGGFIKNENGQIVMSKLDEDSLRQLAKITGGVYKKSTASASDLQGIYLNGMKKNIEARSFGKKSKQSYKEYFFWLVLLAFILFFIEFSLKDDELGVREIA